MQDSLIMLAALPTTVAGPDAEQSICCWHCRYAMVLEDMKITKWEIEEGGDMKASAAASFLADL